MNGQLDCYCKAHSNRGAVPLCAARGKARLGRAQGYPPRDERAQETPRPYGLGARNRDQRGAVLHDGVDRAL